MQDAARFLRRPGLAALCAVAFFGSACNGSSGIVTTPDAGPDAAPDAAPADDTWDIVFPELTPAGDGPASDAPGFDAGPDAGGPGCEPGEGCFLDPCGENGDCASGWCVAHMGEKVCTQTCQEECPAGWSCQQVGGTAPDLLFACVSDYPTLCRPCSAGDDCEDLAGAKDACLSYGDEGAFCGGGCGEDGACPAGFSCLAAETLDGVALEQCVADAGTCPCTGTSVALGLWTACTIENEWGTCAGKRVCEDAGLSDCDAPVPAQETCNGEDDDCDGATDEELCDDGNPCTDDQCVPGAGCSFIPLDGVPCAGEDPCAGSWICQQGACVAVGAVDCDDGKVCTVDSCDPADGSCSHAPDDGKCPATNNPCVGQIFCDPLAGPVADPDQDGCVIVMKAPGTGCSDGDLCTTGDTCEDEGGILVCTGAPVDFDDGNPCTVDSCEPDTGPAHTWIDGCELPCAPGEVVSADCGLCGTHSKTCPESGKWSDAAWSECVGQGVCTPGVTEAEACGNCGTQVRTCTPLCQWDAWGPCEAEGVCTPGELQWEACEGLCSSKATTCTVQCQWGPWSACEVQGDCSPGAGETQPCGACGTQARSCTDLCTWSAWGPCEGQGACAAGAQEQAPCGLCGVDTRTCTVQCQWGPWGGCAGEGECSPGEAASQDCGNCGSQTRTCTAQCQWDAWGACGGQGDCAPGALESLPCGSCGFQQRHCDAQCQWGPWGDCGGEGICAPGELQSQDCGNCGSMVSVCGASCSWGPWSGCDDPCACECAGGTCCSNGCDWDPDGTSCGDCKLCDGAGACSVNEPDGTPCPGGQCVNGACGPPLDPPGGRTNFVVALGKIHSGDYVQDWVRLGTYQFDAAAHTVTAAMWNWSQLNPTHRESSGVSPNGTCSGGAGEVRDCDILIPAGFKDAPNDNRVGTYQILYAGSAPYVRIDWTPSWYEEWWLPTAGAETYAVLELKDSDKATVAFAYGSDAPFTERRALSTIVQETGLYFEKWVRKQACSDCTTAAVTNQKSTTNHFTQGWTICGSGLTWVMTWFDPESSDNCNGSSDSSIQYYFFRAKSNSRRDGWWFWHTCKTESGWNECYGCDNSNRHGGSHTMALLQVLDDSNGYVGHVGVEVGFDEGSCSNPTQHRYSDVLGVVRLTPESGWLNDPAQIP